MTKVYSTASSLFCCARSFVHLFALELGLVIVQLVHAICVACLRAAIVMVDEQLLMHVVEDASEDATKRCSNQVLPHVVRQDALGVVWVEGHLHHERANSESWVQTGIGECIDLAHGPEDETDGWDTPDAKIGRTCMLARHLEDVKDKDEGHHHLHVSS